MADLPRRAFVCGHPIAHSRSPIIHSYWLDRYGIAGSYTAIDVAPERFADFLAGLGEAGLAGGNVTIPHKQAAFAAVSRRDAAADAIGAVNTVWFEDGILHGGNTDAYGFAANLDERAPGWVQSRSAVVVGAGGAARAVVHALIDRGVGDIRLANRTAGRAVELAARFSGRISAHATEALPEICADADLLINTTSLGMAGDMGLPADPAWLPDHAIVNDLVYVPLETPLLAAAAARGLKAVDGLGMLLHQAVPGFELWFGRRPEVSPALRDRIVADLDRKK
ncbi:shikimate dehydrogenase [Mesorhizobium sp. 1B3]|uniref:shikimate dehydrogenase n=1 Tax=Mesorhizobium sp. 1B3 TaxID=3243599 RepID=UPI003D9911FA